MKFLTISLSFKSDKDIFFFFRGELPDGLSSDLEGESLTGFSYFSTVSAFISPFTELATPLTKEDGPLVSDSSLELSDVLDFSVNKFQGEFQSSPIYSFTFV